MNAILENIQDLVNDGVKDKETKMTVITILRKEREVWYHSENKKAEKGSYFRE